MDDWMLLKLEFINIYIYIFYDDTDRSIFRLKNNLLNFLFFIYLFELWHVQSVWLLLDVSFYFSVCWKENLFHVLWKTLPGYYPSNCYCKFTMFSEFWKVITRREYLHGTLCIRPNLSSCFSHFHLPVCQVFNLNLHATVAILNFHNGDLHFTTGFIQTRILTWLLLTSCKHLWQLLDSLPTILLWEIPSYKSVWCSALYYLLVMAPRTPGSVVPHATFWRWQGGPWWCSASCSMFCLLW